MFIAIVAINIVVGLDNTILILLCFNTFFYVSLDSPLLSLIL